MQLVTVAVCYVVNFTPTLPKSDLFPYDDLLLPPDTPPPITEDDVDVETGDQFRQRRMGKGPRYQHVATDENEVWLEEEDEEAEPGCKSCMWVFTNRQRRRASVCSTLARASETHGPASPSSSLSACPISSTSSSAYHLQTRHG